MKTVIEHDEVSVAYTQTVKWYQIDPAQLEVRLSTDFTNGLTEKRAQALQKRYGKNIFDVASHNRFFSRIFSQIKSPLVLILLVAGIATIFLHEYLDSIVIFAAVFINIVIGLFQEERASRAFEKLHSSQEHFATVVRDGRKKKVNSVDIVVGDVVELVAGMAVPADVRILESTELKINESPLTGEWVAVPKHNDVIEGTVPLSGQDNMAWMGTLVSSGFGRGVVVDIAMDTHIGAIAGSLKKEQAIDTPIQKSIHKLARFISYVAISATVLIFILGLARGGTLLEVVLVAIAIAVSVVPEGLPAAVTAVLAIGMEKILAEGGLVRNILAAETLGSTTIIITDKTGTLTQAQMVVSGFVTYKVRTKKEQQKLNDEVLLMAVLASDGFVEETHAENDGFIVHGRPIEKAIIRAGLEAGISQEILKKDNERIDFLAFSSVNRFAASLNKHSSIKKNRLYLSGEPEKLIRISSKVVSGDSVEEFGSTERTYITKQQEKKSKEGMRMIGVAYIDVPGDTITKTLEGMLDEVALENVVFGGLLAFSDPIREDVSESIFIAQQAGTRVVMATGDNPETARTIARQAGIVRSDAKTVLGSDIDKMSDEELLRLIKESDVFARMLPSHKLRMVNILRNSDEIVAMTGDGINDAPALQSADIGIAVGSGTEVAKEASDLILLDNSFTVIVSAIREGRRIIGNLKKIITHLVSTSFGEIFLVVGSLIFGSVLPILPAQILWVNIIEGGLLNFAFAFEPAEKTVMNAVPKRDMTNHIVTPSIKKLIIIVGTITGALTLALFLVLVRVGLPIEQLRTIMFVTLSIDSLFFMLSIKSFTAPLWKINFSNNLFLIVSMVASLLLLLSALFVKPLQHVLQLTDLNSIHFLILTAVALVNLATIEIAKYFMFWRNDKALVL